MSVQIETCDNCGLRSTSLLGHKCLSEEQKLLCEMAALVISGCSGKAEINAKYGVNVAKEILKQVREGEK